MTKPDSRPRAICTRLEGTLVTTPEMNSDQVSIVDEERPSGRFALHRLGAEIWQAVHNTRLPIIVITDLPEPEILSAVNALPSNPDWVITTASNDAAATGLSPYEKITADLRTNAHDVL